jgi:hypothetical protein
MKYMSTYFISFSAVILVIAVFNWFIDPFGMYWSPQVENVNQVKPEAGTRSRITKAYQVNSIKPQVLIVGNSRVEMGLDPTNKHFKNRTVYNQGMPGAGISMQIDYAIDAINNNDTIELLLIGVDFLDFLIDTEEIAKFKAQHKSEANYIFRLTSQDKDDFSSVARFKEKLAILFSLDTFSASISTLFRQSAMVSSITPCGFNSALSYVPTINSEGIKPLFRQKLQEISTRLASKHWNIKAKDTPPYSPNFAHLGRLIEVTQSKNIDVKFFINPYHASYLHTIVENNQWGNFQLWKQTLVQYLNQIQGNDYALWDFSGASRFINEAVPLSNPKTQMQWFWEPAHYRKELGDIMLMNLFTERHDKHDSFGQQLTLNNITDLLKQDKKSLQKHLGEWKGLQLGLQLGLQNK